MAITGHSKGGSSRGGRPGMGGSAPKGFKNPMRGSVKNTSISSPSMPKMSTPVAPPAPTININMGNNKHRRNRGGGLVNSIVSSATSAAVGVASAAIVNKIHENSQIKIQEKQAENQAKIAAAQAEQQARLAAQQAEYQLEMERLKVRQAEVKLDEIQDKRYYANCPYCMGVNNGEKFCQYCGSSLAYYDEDDDDNASNKKK